MNRAVQATRLKETDFRQFSLPDDDFASEVIRGLSGRPKRLPSKYFYDAEGSALFEKICDQPEYYLTRTELEIMRDQAASMAAALGPELRLIEFGSGAGLKTRLLLEALRNPVCYVPVEISQSALDDSVAQLREDFPQVQMQPVCADFTQALCLPRPAREPRRTVIYFPGSTIGNFSTPEADALLREMRLTMGPYGAALIGLDLKKDIGIMEAAYNDAAGVTAEFTLNLLARINRELEGDFDLDRFEHQARYNTGAGRIETRIISRFDQTVRVAGQGVTFLKGEAMLVEYSTKYSLDDVEGMAARANLHATRRWFDRSRRFCVQLLERTPLSWSAHAGA